MDNREKRKYIFNVVNADNVVDADNVVIAAGFTPQYDLARITIYNICNITT